MASEEVENKLGKWIANVAIGIGAQKKDATKYAPYLAIIIIFAIGIIAGHFLENYIDDLTAKVVPYAQMDLPIKGSNGQEYVPLTIQNHGQKSMTNVLVKATTCFSVDSGIQQYFSEYPVGTLQGLDKKEIAFNDSKTMAQVKKKFCPPAVGEWQEKGGFSVNPTGPIGQTSTQNIVMCGWCPYKITVHSDQGDFNFEGVLRAPFDTTIEVTRES